MASGFAGRLLYGTAGGLRTVSDAYIAAALNTNVGFREEGFADLFTKLLAVDPDHRITAKQASSHP